ncbi:methylated-DNA--[protein]-cysteine S-methyltransferase [Acinetobacter baylyi]|uniref:methylated-DNA--[protein]-cysteine S-methyltransferase n=1 Tax=Acinetobacter baylyi TaxID=202950 RepID=UPI000EA0EBA5|nr:methylated-DNA--[protein]-cysteine S-methyltransferase [Acinetobacter baylyi]
MEQLFYRYIDSPVGKLKLVASDTALVAILWENENPKRVQLANLTQAFQHPVLLQTKLQLEEYFLGKRQYFEISLDLQGTPFQRQVWTALQTIPYGKTCSYKQIAQMVGREKAMRAVGAANGKNPISIIVPCHRVIGAAGTLVGFAGGIDKKQKLLALESSFTI